MTLGTRAVIINPLYYDLVGAPGTSNAVVVRIRPTSEYDDGTGTGGVEKIWSPPVRIQGAPQTKDFPVTPVDLSWALQVMIEVLNDGYGGRSKRILTVAVPAGAEALELEALQRVDPRTLQPVSTVLPAVEVRIQDLEAWRDSFDPGAPGGSITSADLDDATPLSIEFIGTSTQADARTVIDAAATTHTHVVGQIATVGGTASSTTFLAGDGQWRTPAGSGTASWPVSGTPSVFPPDAHTQDISTINGLQAALDNLADAVALKADANNASFTGTFSIAPGSLSLAGLNDLVGYLRDDWGLLPIIWINDVTDEWPSTRVVPTGYGSGPAYLDSSAVANAVTPTIGVAGDRWRRKKPTV